MVGLSPHLYLGLSTREGDFDFFNHLCLNPYIHTLDLVILVRAFQRVCNRLHPNVLGAIRAPPDIQFTVLSTFMAIFKGKDVQWRTTILRDINRRGKDGWVSTWGLDNEPGHWFPTNTFRETQKRLAKGKYTY